MGSFKGKEEEEGIRHGGREFGGGSLMGDCENSVILGLLNEEGEDESQ